MQFRSVEVCDKYVYEFGYYFNSQTKRTEGPFTLTYLLINSQQNNNRPKCFALNLGEVFFSPQLILNYILLSKSFPHIRIV